MDNPVVRLTWQVSRRNKFAVYMDRAMRLRGHAMDVAHRSDHRIGRVAHADLRAPDRRSGRRRCRRSCSLESGFSFNRERYDNLYQPGILAERNTPEWYQQRAQERHEHGPARGTRRARSSATIPIATTCSASTSYVTGTHNVKFGFQDSVGHLPPLQQRERRPVPDLQQRRCRCAGHGAEHAARGRRGPRREPRASTPRTRGTSTS